MVDTIDSAWRDNDVQGDPGTKPYKPKKAPQRTVLKRIEASAGIGAVAVATKAELDAITDKAEHAPGFVVGDSTASNNGQYSWDDSGSAWVKIRDLPDTATILEGAAGTNDVTANVATGVNPAAVSLFVLILANTNTGAMTLAIEGETAQDFKTYAGDDFASGAIVAGRAYLVFDTGSEYRALNDDRILPFRGAYAAPTTYSLGDLAENGGSIWYSLQDDNTGNTPSEGAYWTEFLPGVTVADNSVTNAKLTAAHSLALSHTVADRTALKALDDARYKDVWVQGSSGGRFVWDSSDLSTEVAADTQEGVYVAPTVDATGASGAWVRQYEGNLWANWFGFSTSETAANNNTYLQAAIDFAKTQTETILTDKYVITTSDVLINRGEYNLSGTVDLYTGVRLIGNGQSNTFINHTGGAVAAFDFVSSSGEFLYNTWILDIAFKGAGKTSSDTTAFVKSSKPTGGLSIYGCGVARCLITNTYDGISLENSWTFSVIDNEIFDVGRNFIRGLNMTSCRLVNNRMDVAGEDGLYITYSATASIETIALYAQQNVIQSCQRRGIYGIDCDHFMWDHNYVENCNQAGGYPHVEFEDTTGTNSEMYSFVGGWLSPSSNSGQPAVKIEKARFVSGVGTYARSSNFTYMFELGAGVEGYSLQCEANTTNGLVSVDDGTPGIATNRLNNKVSNPKLVGFVNYEDSGELTIATGEITVTGTRHAVDTESDASTDDLDTINGGSDGDILFLQPANSSRDVVVKNGTGNIFCGSDKTLNNVADIICLLKRGSNWHMISYANN